MTNEEIDQARDAWLREHNSRAPIIDQDAREWSIEVLGKWIVRAVIAVLIVAVVAVFTR